MIFVHTHNHASADCADVENLRFVRDTRPCPSLFSFPFIRAFRKSCVNIPAVDVATAVLCNVVPLPARLALPAYSFARSTDLHTHFPFFVLFRFSFCDVRNAFGSRGVFRKRTSKSLSHFTNGLEDDTRDYRRFPH